MRVIQSRRELDLTQKAIGAECAGKLGVKDLECDGSIVLCILREINRCHSTAAKLAVDCVETRESAFQPIDWRHLRHLLVVLSGDANVRRAAPAVKLPRLMLYLARASAVTINNAH